MPTSKRKAVKRRPARRAVRGRRSKADAPIEAALAGLAHDIRTPLGGILAMAELLQASDLPERERLWAETIRTTADHLAQLTTIVVDAARAGAGKLVVRQEPFAPQVLAEAIAASLAARASAKGLSVKVAIPRKLPRSVVGDAVRLRAALENLIDNAVKFTERGSVQFRVSSSVAPRDRVVLQFAVADSGIGIVAADLKRLFRPFSQASTEVTRRYGGAGLGLVSVKQMAKAMGGKLSVVSEPGRGSTFTLSVTLPVVRAAARAASNSSARPRGRALHVLSVEDNPYGRAVLKTVIEELGHRVTFASDGEKAIEQIATGAFDAVLMDMALPGIDGLETARRIRDLPGMAGNITIIGLSGRSEAHDAAAAKAAGMNGYLRKPASPAELHEMLGAIRPVARPPSRG